MSSKDRKKYNTYEYKDDCVIINDRVIVDKEDLPLIESYDKYVAVNSSGYALMWVGDRELFIHRLLMGLPARFDKETQLIADHINGDRLDNRKQKPSCDTS